MLSEAELRARLAAIGKQQLALEVEKTILRRLLVSITDPRRGKRVPHAIPALAEARSGR